MSSYVHVEFYSKNNKKLISRVIIDQLKYKLENVESSYSPIEGVEAGVYWNSYFIGYVKKGTYIELNDFSNFENSKCFLKKDAELIKKYEKICNETPSKEELDKYYSIFGYKKMSFNGDWYNIGCFVDARDKAEKKIKDAYRKKITLEKIKENVDYYKLDKEQQLDLDNDLEYANDIIEEEQNSAYAYQYMINLMSDFIKDDNSLDWKDEVIAYIYVS